MISILSETVAAETVMHVTNMHVHFLILHMHIRLVPLSHHSCTKQNNTIHTTTTALGLLPPTQIMLYSKPFLCVHTLYFQVLLYICGIMHLYMSQS